MNAGDSAGAGPNETSPPSAVDRRANASVTQISSTGPAITATQMSQQTNTRASTHLQQQQQLAQSNQSLNSSIPSTSNSNFSGTSSCPASVSDILRAHTTSMITSSNVSDITTRSNSDPRTPNKSTSPTSIGTDHSSKKRTTASSEADSIINYKKRNLDHRSSRLKILKER